jgi:putative transposase
MRYRRSRVVGGTYFFTLVAADRHAAPFVEHIDALRSAFRFVRARRPFEIDAIVVLPDHLHVLLTLPEGDADFATRLMLIKQRFSLRIPPGDRIDASRAAKGERGVWQRRYWEHAIRDEEDLLRHIEYIHFNPVKHGHVLRAGDWPHSSIHRYIRRGLVDAGWGVSAEVEGDFGE